MKDVRRLIKNECCNYIGLYCGKHSYCLDPAKKEAPCVYFEDEPGRCSWFEVAVLPLKPELIEDMEKKVCEGCGGRFVPSSSRQKYCLKCKEKRAKEQRKEWAARKRSQSRKVGV